MTIEFTVPFRRVPTPVALVVEPAPEPQSNPPRIANQSISVSTNVSDPCGRLLTQVASVTLAGADIIGIGNSCSGILAGSNGLSGAGTTVPEPGAVVLCGSGIAYLLARTRGWARRRQRLSRNAGFARSNGSASPN